MAGLLYNLLLVLLFPIVLMYYLWRVLVARKSNESWKDNLGFLPELSSRPAGQKLVWLHAASVGEVVASIPVLDRVKQILPDAVILVTTITQTGNAVARKSAKSADFISYLPLDYPVFVERALNRVAPDVFVMVEAEIWPNLLDGLKRRGVGTVLINGRMSDRTMRRLRWWRWLIAWAVSKIDECCMQSKSDAERLLYAGARQESLKTIGSTKFDQEGSHLSESAVGALQRSLGLAPDSRVLVAGSTNPGEDDPVISAFRDMRQRFPDLKLIIAPRQIDRAEEVQSMVESAGLRCARRSLKDSASAYDVLILDTFGELAAIYAVADITFVGGTLIRKGGHSIIQPILQGKPVLFGPHTFKTRDVARMAVAAGVGFEVADAEALARRGAELLADASARAEIEAVCLRLADENRGASDRCAEVIVRLSQARTEQAGVS